MTSCLGTGSTAMLESSRHVKSVDAGHCGGERHVRGQGGTVRGASRVRESRAAGCAARCPPRGWSVSCELQGVAVGADISVILQEATAV